MRMCIRSLCASVLLAVQFPSCRSLRSAPFPALAFGASRSCSSSSSSSRGGYRSTDRRLSASTMQFVDIGANLLDERFTEGSYFGRKKHEPDWKEVLERASSAGLSHIVLTAGTLRESRRALELVRELRRSDTSVCFGCTVGVHPTRSQQEFVDSDLDATDVLEELARIVDDGLTDGSVVAIGEIGLDYDRLEFCPKEIQQEYFARQLETFRPYRHLPLFLHNRSVDKDLLEELQKQTEPWKGVVHSFDDTLELAQEFIDMGLYIGLNGCSLKTEENLQVAKELQLDRILLETDCPYCEIKQSHAGFHHVRTKFEKKPDKKFELGKMVKGRNEPCQIVQVAEVVAGVKGVPVEDVASACHSNSMKLYGWQ